MKKVGFVKKSLALLNLAALSLILATALIAHAAVMNQPYINDSFDDGFNAEKWQVVNDPSNTIGFAGDAGTMRYVDVTGAEEALVTTEPLTTGEGVTGYSVAFDFKYLSADWGDWYAFAFNKTSVVKGLDWGKGGYLLGRITSLQTNNAADSVDGLTLAAGLTSFEQMTPTLASIALQNVRFKFVYTHADQKVSMYYDLVSDTMDLTTVRNTFTFDSLTDAEDYHFAIVSSGKGLYELDNLEIHKLTATDPITYLEADFETNVLPDEITVADATKFSYGPAMALEFNDVDPNAMFITKDAFERDTHVDTSLMIKYQFDAQTLALDKKFSFIFGLQQTTDTKVSEGVIDLYIVNRDVAGTVTSFIGATRGDGTQAVQVLNETALPVNLSGYGIVDFELSFNAFNNIEVSLNDTLHYAFKAVTTIGHFGFASEDLNHVLIDNFESKAYIYYDQTNSPDLYENFNTGYLDSNLWEIYNYRDLKPGTEMPLFPTAKGIYIENGQLVFDVAGESARLITMHDYANVEVRFSLNQFGIPTTPMNEDGEIDGVEVPPTFYVALSFGYETTTQNFWNVPTIIFQARDGGAVIYSLNMNDATVYAIEQDLLMSSEANQDETFEYKVIAQNGNVDIWMKRASDPIALFDGEPTISYQGVNTAGRVAIASSAAGSFKIDNLSIVKTGGAFDQPVIEDSINPEKLIAPVISIDTTKPVIFEQNSEITVDFKTYFSVTDQNATVSVTDDMLDLGGFTLSTVGQYEITLTVTDADNNTVNETIVVSVFPEIIEQQEGPNVVLISVLTGIGSLSVGAAGVFLVLKKIKKF
jgi:hypothetical protein